MRAFTETSSAETLSSATIRRGSSASARAMQMRWRWPPENSCGWRRMCSGASPTRRKSSATRSRRSAGRPMPWIASGSATRSPTVIRGSSEA